MVLTVVSFIFSSPIFVLAPLLASVLMLTKVKAPLSRIDPIVKPLLPVFVLMLLMTGFTYSTENFRNPDNTRVIFRLFSSNAFAFSVGGLLYGTTLSLRILVMVVASTLLTFTTPIADIIQLMKKIKMPYQLAFVIATGIRFIPVMERKSEMIKQAQMSRGASFGKGGPIKSIKSYIPILIPMIVESIRMSDNLAVAMLNRGFGAMKTTTNLNEIKMKRIDYITCAAALTVLAIAIFLKTENIGVL